MVLPTDKQLLGVRVRMARAKLDEPRPVFADRLGIGEGTLRRIEAGNPKFKPYEEAGFVQRVAEVSGLPVEFFTVDTFEALASEGHADEQLERIENKLDALAKSLSRRPDAGAIDRMFQEGAEKIASSRPPGQPPARQEQRPTRTKSR